jgi:hypothetical protein
MISYALLLCLSLLQSNEMNINNSGFFLQGLYSHDHTQQGTYPKSDRKKILLSFVCMSFELNAEEEGVQPDTREAREGERRER